jgi:hypothetical protein
MAVTLKKVQKTNNTGNIPKASTTEIDCKQKNNPEATEYMAVY